MREPKPVTRVELSDKNNTARWIVVVVLLVIGIVALTVGFMQLLGKESGWQPIQVTTEERSCSENFILRYNFSGSGAEVTTLNKKLEATYADACVKAYQLFTPDESIAGVNNIYYVNHHVNETVTVDPVLYAAFEKLEGTPYLYLGPAYAHCYGTIFNTDEVYLAQRDPAQNEETRVYLETIAGFAGDADAVRLELLGSNQVKLHVSQAYLEFAEAEEIENFIDFGYMTNAFIIDYLADELLAQGLTEGYLASSDGYTRTLDGNTEFSFNIFDRVDGTVYQAAAMEYQGPVGMVFLKSYPTDVSDANYRFNGEDYIHLFADPADGVSRTSVENLVSYSYETGCVDVLLQMLPSFVGDSFTVPEGVFSVWCHDGQICYNDANVTFTNLLSTAGISYQAVLKK